MRVVSQKRKTGVAKDRPIIYLPNIEKTLMLPKTWVSDELNELHDNRSGRNFGVKRRQQHEEEKCTTG